MKRLLAFLLFAVSAACAAARADSIASVPYAWRNVRIGGGGFVTGIVFHPKQPGLVYVRTDVGGAYRWDAGLHRWVPLTDWIGMADVNLMGIESLAVDPSDPRRVYLAAGTYTNPRAGDGAILCSSDEGRTFRRVNMPFKMGGNEAGRGNGERLAVDPNQGSILLFGSRTAGLWRSADHGATWSRVSGFPAVATSPAASISFGPWTQPLGIDLVVFDGRSGHPGAATPVIYAGVSTRETCLFRSTNGGETWAPVPGQPVGLRPTRAALSSNGILYLTYGDDPGPNTMHDGAVWALDTATGAWRDITPVRPGRGELSGFGYGAVTVDRSDPSHLLVSTFCRYEPHDEIFETRDGGRSWLPVLAGSAWNYSGAPWTRGMKVHWMADVEIDPFDSSHALFTTGYGVLATHNLGAKVGHGGPVVWSFDDKGLEETVPLGLISPPEGAHLLSALGDIDGFRHDDLDRAGLQFAPPPRLANTESIAFAGLKPLTVVRCGTMWKRDSGVRAAVSFDGGATWKPFASEPAGSAGAGTIDVTADGRVIFWTPRGLPPPGRTGLPPWMAPPMRPQRTTDFGVTWKTCGDLPAGVRVIADKVDPKRLYAFDPASGRVFASEDAGLTFIVRSQGLPRVEHGAQWTGGPAGYPGVLHAVPGRAGELWLASRAGGLWRSDDGGRHFTHLATVEQAYSLGFGRAAPGRTHPALYLAGEVGGLQALFRSDDAGATWVRINDDRHQYGWISHVTGDPRVYGRVYFGTGGRGVIVGDPR
ncbi:xyloglucanase precursor [mine drainage metagenome]|uniref:Xyloglucanase n=1 Tax=mine drainage metagenome TaxID=410659 RepID=A0A1J5SZ43_9ZZZZ